jgi:hypothetical protein
MSANKLDATDVLRRDGVWPASRLVSAVERFVAAKGESVVTIWALAGFLVLWTLYHTVSNISVSTDSGWLIPEHHVLALASRHLHRASISLLLYLAIEPTPIGLVVRGIVGGLRRLRSPGRGMAAIEV